MSHRIHLCCAQRQPQRRKAPLRRATQGNGEVAHRISLLRRRRRARQISVNRLGGGAPLRLGRAGHERGHRRLRIDRRRVQRLSDELRFRRPARDEREVAGGLVAAPAVDLMTGQAIRLRGGKPRRGGIARPGTTIRLDAMGARSPYLGPQLPRPETFEN